MKSPVGKTFEAVGYALKRASHAQRMRMDSDLRHLKLTAPSFAVLAAVEAKPGLSNAALARLAFVTPQTMQGMVASLEKAGLLARRPDPGHGRILTTSLTGTGRTVVAEARAIVDRIEAEMVEGLPAEEVSGLLRILAHCAARMEDRAER
jgi:DNA-binding MarR family transcriptional regulator